MKKTILLTALFAAVCACARARRETSMPPPVANDTVAVPADTGTTGTTMTKPRMPRAIVLEGGPTKIAKKGSKKGPGGPHSATDIERGKDYATVRIYYATDRTTTGKTAPAAHFGSGRGSFTRGIAHVTMPRIHRIGNIERPSVWKFEFREDPAKHVVLLDVLPQEKRDFYAKLRQSIAQSQKHEAFVFVHGFDNTFEDAALRTAQIKYDLAYDGAAILFSWPSLGSSKPFAYTTDENNAEWATRHFRDFLLELAENSGAASISVVAHSMGNRVLARAFQQLPATPQLRFDQVLLTAPDIDVDIFKDLAEAIRRPAGHVTLYVSKNDEALKLSKKVHGYRRAGDSTEGVLVVDGMETVDVSSVDSSFVGHSYIAENRTVLSDVFCVMRGAAQAARRCRLKERRRYWEFVGQLEDVASLDQYTCMPPGCPFQP
jgi:esterase/lipase superfamily enzyme